MFLRTVAATELLVIVFDDLHWADNESLLLLALTMYQLGFALQAVPSTF